MKKGVALVFIIGLFFLGSIQYFKKQEIQEEFSSAKEIIEKLKERVQIHSIYSGGFQFPQDYGVKSIKREEKRMADIITDSTVVLFIDVLHCRSCVDTYISELENLSSKFKTVIFTVGYNLRDLNLMIKKKKLKTPVYKINKQSSFFDKMRKANYPFLFMLDSKLEVSNIYFPEINSSFDKEYFSWIEN